MWRGYGPVVERHEVVEVPEKRYYPPSPLKSRGLATSLHPLAPFTVQVTGTRFPSRDALLLPKKGPTPSVCSRKALGRSSPPRSSCSLEADWRGHCVACPHAGT